MENGRASVLEKAPQIMLSWRFGIVLIFALVFACVGCHENKSLVQSRLGEWVPASATNLVSISSGTADDTTFVTFSCSPADLKGVRQVHGREEVWRRGRLDRRTADLLKSAIGILHIEPAQQPPPDTGQFEFLWAPETEPYGAVGDACVIDPATNRVWYVHSEM